jgi:hypothetical protein
MPSVAVAALHPGTTATELSLPFQKSVKPEKLFTAEQTAEYLAKVIEVSETGKFYSWDGSELPW